MAKLAPKKQMQNVSFNSLEEFYDYLPDDEKKVLEFLRKIIYDCIPEITEKLSYNVPFFKRNSNICFLWPASVTWGGVKQIGVRMGFTKGYLLTDEENYLDKGGRKNVYWKDFESIKEVDVDMIRALLFESLELDQLKKKPTKSK